MISIFNSFSLVHKLRPADIQYIAAIGDSLTVGIWKEKQNIQLMLFRAILGS
jgi:hypothetical protein